MLDQKIHVLGDDDVVLMLGLLGIEGTIIEIGDSFLELFNELIKDPSIGMIIIRLPLSKEEYEFLIDFKLYNKMPLVFILPDLFQSDIDKTDVIRNKIYDSIGDILSL